MKQTSQRVPTGMHELKCTSSMGDPYLGAAGIEDGIKFIFTMTPLMPIIAAASEFIQTDVTYDGSREYSYLFNAVAFDGITMEYTIIARVRLSQQTA